MRRLVRFLGCAATALSITIARAEPPRTSSLGWVRLPGAEACIGSRDLALAVEQRLGRSVFVSPAQARVFIEGRVEPQPEGRGFRAHVALSDDRGALLGIRDLDTQEADCHALDEQLALVVALLIDPDAALAPRGAPRPAPPPPPPPRVVVQRVFVPMPAPPRAPEPWRERLELSIAMALGLLPGVAGGLSLRGEIAPPSFVPVALGAGVWLPDEAETGPKGSLVSMSYGLLGLCPSARSKKTGTTLRGCALIEAGAIQAKGHGFRISRGEQLAIVQAAVEGRLSQALVGPLEIGLGLGAVVPIRRARFFYLDASGQEQELFRMSAVAGVLDMGVGVAFP